MAKCLGGSSSDEDSWEGSKCCTSNEDNYTERHDYDNVLPEELGLQEHEDSSLDYLDFGLRKCAEGHYFPMNDRRCEICGGFPVPIEDSTTGLEFVEDNNENSHLYERSELLEFGLLICEYGHTFHKTWIQCNICGANSRREKKKEQPMDKHFLLTPGYFHIEEPKFIPDGWTCSSSKNKDKKVTPVEEELRKKKELARQRELFPPEMVDVGTHPLAPGFNQIYGSRGTYGKPLHTTTPTDESGSQD